MTLIIEKYCSLQQINEKNLLLTLVILKLLSVELILVMQIKGERNQGLMDASTYHWKPPSSQKGDIFVLGTWIPEISHYHRTKFWAKLTFWSVTESRKEEFMRLVPDSQ